MESNILIDFSELDDTRRISIDHLWSFIIPKDYTVLEKSNPEAQNGKFPLTIISQNTSNESNEDNNKRGSINLIERGKNLCDDYNDLRSISVKRLIKKNSLINKLFQKELISVINQKDILLDYFCFYEDDSKASYQIVINTKGYWYRLNFFFSAYHKVERETSLIEFLNKANIQALRSSKKKVDATISDNNSTLLKTDDEEFNVNDQGLLSSYVGNSESIVIPSEVKVIGNNAFANNLNIREVMMSDGVDVIENSAFMNCRNLEKVTFSRSIRIIKDKAFYRCSQLTEAKLPPKIEAIGEAAFSLTKINAVQLPGTLEFISKSAFSNCPKLSKITFENGLSEVGEMAFFGCPIEKIDFPSSLRKIADFAFHSSKLSCVLLNEGIEEIGCQSFSVKGSLDLIYIPSTLRKISLFSFGKTHASTKVFVSNNPIMHSRLKDYSNAWTIIPLLPEAASRYSEILSDSLMTYINNPHFNVAFNPLELVSSSDILLLDFQERINISTNDSRDVKVEAKDNELEKMLAKGQVEEFAKLKRHHVNNFEYLSNGYLLAYHGAANRIEIPEGVKVIGRRVFEDKKEIIEVTMPDSVAMIEEGAFVNCRSLRTLTLSKNLKEIGNFAFRGCRSLAQISLPENLVSIGNGTFGMSGIESLVIPDSVLHIGMGAFWYCQKLTNVILPANLREIGIRLFFGCPLEYIELPERLKLIGDEAFRSTRIKTIIIPDGLDSIGARAFCNNTSYKQVVIPSSVTAIGEGAFGYSYTKSVLYVESGSYAEEYAKQYELTYSTIILPTKLLISNGQIYLDDKTQNKTDEEFLVDQNGCLIGYKGDNENVVIPDNVSSIGEWAFANNNHIKYVEFSGNLQRIDKFAFYNCHSLRKVKLNEGLEEIGESAFRACGRLQYVNFPHSLKIIRDFAFSYTKLSHISLFKNIATIGHNAFAHSTLKTDMRMIYIMADKVRIKDDAFGSKYENFILHVFENSQVAMYAQKNVLNYLYLTD